VACDASQGMIEIARCRRAELAPETGIEFHVVRNEELGLLRTAARFDGALSNFSGLNCVEDVGAVAGELGELVRAGGAAVICVSTRLCLWEIGWYVARRKFAKAFRRVSGTTIAHLDGGSVPVWYSSTPGSRGGTVCAAVVYRKLGAKARETAESCGSAGPFVRTVAGAARRGRSRTAGAGKDRRVIAWASLASLNSMLKVRIR
jgi:hypothetical protein